MQLDFSGDGLPEPSFENAVDHDAEGFATVPVCGVPLRLRQSEILGGRLWTGGLSLALEIERGVALRELGEGRDGAPSDGTSLEGKRVIELGAGCVLRSHAVVGAEVRSAPTRREDAPPT